MKERLKKIYSQLKKEKQGVTLMETIVALGILTMGIITALSLMTSSISFSQSSEQSIVVVNLAREGIEMTRGLKFLSGFEALTEGTKTVTINNSGALEFRLGSSPIKDCSTCNLYLYNGRYVHNSSGTPTIFKRLITISNESANEKKILSQVYWSERGREHAFTLEDHLTNWWVVYPPSLHNWLINDFGG